MDQFLVLRRGTERRAAISAGAAASSGGGLQRHELDHVEIAAAEPSDDLLALNEALVRFEAKDGLKAELVKLRYFAGLTIPQAAEALGVSSATADRYWAYARAWLHSELASGNSKLGE